MDEPQSMSRTFGRSSSAHVPDIRRAGARCAETATYCPFAGSLRPRGSPDTARRECQSLERPLGPCSGTSKLDTRRLSREPWSCVSMSELWCAKTLCDARSKKGTEASQVKCRRRSCKAAIGPPKGSVGVDKDTQRGSLVSSSTPGG